MAYEIPGLVLTMESAADLSSHQYKFVKLDSNGKVAAIAANTDKPFGILQDAPAAADRACQVMVMGVSKVQGDADLSKGAQISTSADGQAVAAVPGTATTQYIVGEVLEDNSAANGIATVAFNCLGAGRGA